MRFGSPQYLWLLLLGPLLAWFLWWGIRKRQRMVAAFIPPRLLGGLLLGVSWQRERWRAVLLVAAFALFVLALAQPQWGFSWQEVKVRGLDIVVAIDTSRSMLAEDLRPNRLARAKLAAIDIAREAKSDRLALVAFAGTGFLQVPLTIDDVVFRQGVDSLSIDSIPVGGSMLAEAIRAATTAFKEGENYRVLILLSDGEDNAEGALEEARRAAEAGLRIYTIGIGTPEGSRIPIQRVGGTVDYVMNDDGTPVVTRINEDLLRQIASATEGGIYLPLRGARTMETLYHEVLAKLPKSEHQEKLVRQYMERFHWPLTAGILLILAEMFWPMFSGRRSLPHAILGKASAALAKPAVWLLLAASTTLPAPAASSSQALREYNSGDYARSLRDYEALLRKSPGDARLHYNAGAAAYQKGDVETALKHFNEAAKAEDLALQQQAYYNRGNTRFNSGSNEQDPKRRSSEWKQALQDYESALKLNGKDADAIHNREFVKRMLQELQQQNPQSSDDQQKSEDQQDQQQNKSKDQQNSSGDNKKQDQKQQQQSSEQQPQQNQQQQNSQNSEPQDAQQKQNPNADQQKASKQPEDSSQENQQKEKERSPAEKNQQDQQQQQTNAQGQTNQPPSSADSAAGEQRPGQMTPEQARRILDSQREGEKLMPASSKQQVPGRRNLKNW